MPLNVDWVWMFVVIQSIFERYKAYKIMMTLVDVRETNFEACLQKEGIRNFQDLCSSISMLGNLQKALKHLKACLNDF